MVADSGALVQATEQLMYATWVLAAAGLSTLVVAVVAAFYAVKTYVLEAKPCVYIASTMDVPNGVAAENRQFRLSDYGDAGLAIDRPFEGMPGSAGFFVEVTNASRTPILELSVYISFSARLGAGDASRRPYGSKALRRGGTGCVSLKVIRPGETRYIPIYVNVAFSDATSCVIPPIEVDVLRVEASTPGFYKRIRKYGRLRFVASAAAVGPIGDLETIGDMNS